MTTTPTVDTTTYDATDSYVIVGKHKGSLYYPDSYISGYYARNISGSNVELALVRAIDQGWIDVTAAPERF